MKTRTKKIVWTALFAALTVVATYVVKIPTPTNGYVNMGDAVVILAAFVAGPVYGALAAAIGSGIADLAAGYAVYAPATFIIKGIMALVCGIVFKVGRKSVPSAVVCAVIAEIIMILGYFAFEATFMGLGIGAAVGIPANAVQAVFGAAASVILYKAVSKLNIV